VLCGSARFRDEFEKANLELTLQGEIVLAPAFHSSIAEQGEGIGISPQQKRDLDELHRRKIDLADRVLVLNVGGYLGESTHREVEYAREHGKPVHFLEPLNRAH
jgi:hypothetical protein